MWASYFDYFDNFKSSFAEESNNMDLKKTDKDKFMNVEKWELRPFEDCN
jgi:hypothetical protein